MTRSEALGILGLPSTAAAAEIKDAYRDLAKVWHPDRFGSDSRLRTKAEDTLKTINEAYQTLQRDRGSATAGEGPGAARRPTPPPPRSTPPPPPRSTSPPRSTPPPPRSAPPPGSTPPPPPRSAPPPPRTTEAPPPKPQGAPALRDARRWLTAVMAVLICAGVISSLSKPASTPPGHPVSPVEEAAATEPSSDIDFVPTTVPRSTPPKERGGDSNGVPTRPSASKASTPRPSSDDLDLRPTDGGTTLGKRAYAELSRPEQQSIEAACSRAKYMQGPAAYNRCLTEQLARLAVAPSRPDLSALTRPEQQSIEAACSRAEVHVWAG